MSGRQAKAPAGPLVVVAEHAQGRLSPVTLELVSCARALAALIGGKINLVVIAQDAQALAQEALEKTGEAVIALVVEGLVQFHGEAYRRLLTPLINLWQARAVLAAHTTSGLDWLPGLAAGLGMSCVTAVEEVHLQQDRLALSRTAIFGKAMEDLCPTGWPLALTVQPGSFASAQPGSTPPSAIQVLDQDYPACRSRLLASPPGETPDQALDQAQVVIAAGRGVGKPENLELLRDLAACFSGAALAGSRPVCDMGWLGYRSQVGLTGTTVSPRLYVACGISGARQHTVGMQGAGFIVAVNTDPRAAIFQMADVRVVEDLALFIPAFLQCCRK